MFGSEIECPVCRGQTGGVCRPGNRIPAHDSEAYRCTACGNFEIGRSTFASYFSETSNQLTKIQRAALSHKIRSSPEPSKVFLILKPWLDDFLGNANLPSTAEQVENLIRIVGEHSSTNGNTLFIKEPELIAKCGILNGDRLRALLEEILNSGLIKRPIGANEPEDNDFGAIIAWGLSLTFSGDEAYEHMKAGRAWHFRDGVVKEQVTGTMHNTYNISGSIGALVESATNSTVVGVVGNLDIGSLEKFVQQVPEMVKFLPNDIQESVENEIAKMKTELQGERRGGALMALLQGIGKMVSGVRDNMMASALTALLIKDFGLTMLGQ